MNKQIEQIEEIEGTIFTEQEVHNVIEFLLSLTPNELGKLKILLSPSCDVRNYARLMCYLLEAFKNPELDDLAKLIIAPCNNGAAH